MYKAIITKIHTRPIPGADNIVLGSCHGYNVIVNKETDDGETGVFFESGGQLSLEFSMGNLTIMRKHPETGEPCGGYFEANRRVTAIKMRGVKSEGFWCPLSYLDFTGADVGALKVGEEFDTLNGIPICQKYITPATRKAQQNRGGKKSRGSLKMFPKHVDTGMLRREIGMIPTGAVVHISEKLHGTSMRFGHVLDDIPLTGWRKLWARLTRQPLTRKEWTNLNGSRNVVIEKREGDDFYGKAEFRENVTRGIELYKGEVIFGEIVGYTDTGALIMASQGTGALRDKKIRKTYGDTMTYTYGCESPGCALYVYRIARFNADGVSTELSWGQMVARCRELGLRPVPSIQTLVYYGDQEALLNRVKALINGEDGTGSVPSMIDQTHIREGVVVRYESEHGTGWMKEKSFHFGCLEGYLKERDDYVDTEESA